MNELSLNILDVAYNSITAKAKNLEIKVDISSKNNLIIIDIIDDGSGMDKDFLSKVTDPFATSRSTRRVGLGLPLFKMTAELSGGKFSIDSQKGKGTQVKASFLLDSIDRPPLGDLASTITILINGAGECDISLAYVVDNKDYIFSTKEVKEVLGQQDLTDITILEYLKQMIEDNIKLINGGVRV